MKKRRPWKHYVGLNVDGKYEYFRSEFEPTEKNCGHIYKFVIGPFKTKRGALFMEKYGKNNPHCYDVDSTEITAIAHELKNRAIRKGA